MPKHYDLVTRYGLLIWDNSGGGGGGDGGGVGQLLTYHQLDPQEWNTFQLNLFEFQRRLIQENFLKMFRNKIYPVYGNGEWFCPRGAPFIMSEADQRVVL